VCSRKKEERGGREKDAPALSFTANSGAAL